MATNDDIAYYVVLSVLIFILVTTLALWVYMYVTGDIPSFLDFTDNTLYYNL